MGRLQRPHQTHPYLDPNPFSTKPKTRLSAFDAKVGAIVALLLPAPVILFDRLRGGEIKFRVYSEIEYEVFGELIIVYLRKRDYRVWGAIKFRVWGVILGYTKVPCKGILV